MIKDKVIEQINRLEEEIRTTPYHKGTEHHIGRLKAKISKLKKDLEDKSVSGSGGGEKYAVSKQGDATAVLVGPPSVGKSTLLNKLTGAKSKIGDYPFTTLEVVPGMFMYHGAKIQLLDVPGLVTGAAVGRGDGRQILSVVRNSDLIILITDVNQPQWLSKAKKELYQAGIRLNTQQPNIVIKKKNKGGLRVVYPYDDISAKTILSVGNTFGLENADIIIKEKLGSIDRLIDGISKDRVFVPAVEIINKADLKKISQPNCLTISAQTGAGLDELKDLIWQKLNLIRVYFKPSKDEKPDKEKPLILKKESRVKDALEAISSDLVDEVAQVFIWGKKAKYPGQAVSLNQPLFDGAELYFKK